MAGAADEWVPRTASPGFPLAPRIAAFGAGVGVGCGVGLGVGRPVSLSAVPLLGQATSGMAAGLGASLGGAGAALQGAGAEARRRVQGLGVAGLDAGFGCGVGVGYGFFAAGLLLKPSVIEAVREGASELAGRAVDAVQGSLRALGVPLPAEQPWPDGGAATAQLQAPPPFVAQQLLPSAAGAAPQREGQPARGAAARGPADATAAAGLGSDREVLRALLRHERTIRRLERQNRALRAALCGAHPKAAVCGRGGGWDGDTSGDGAG
ncbi:hypothetical protein Rsub_03523 [Raphidocelis subcapitata]|uniref:Uncharacterized protein n=1 Tax=Raphidocelis subcapitata TaxID=307507 RepID=A0A2V0P023_9CHLO|nr:hypothetical protein Rsub_03523 [Raphidocelis subcapitata]|eukprot:GBF90527.1 hypothetical protein Rsub_03523 [Raphidocelis subcapitata]